MVKNFDLESLTSSVLEAYTSRTNSERARQIFSSLISHLHAFVQEVELTEQEWFIGIDYLTRTGQMCDDKRQEFILLSDVLGVSMLVDILNHPRAGLGTESTVLGPFYVDNAPEIPKNGSIIRKDIGAEQVLVRGKVTDQQGNPIAGATLDIWQTSENGFYDVQDAEQPEYNMRGKATSDANGEYGFITERPRPYAVPTDGPVGELLTLAGRHAMRPAHIHFIISAPGFSSVTTHLFCEGDEYLESDAVFATKASLIADFSQCEDQELSDMYGLQTPFTIVSYDFGLVAEERAT